MKQTIEILEKAYTIINSTGNILTPESTAIRSIFLSNKKILLFSNPDLYLKFIKRLTEEQSNLTFPETNDLYDTYFLDCITLKEQMEKNSASFPEEDYLNYVILLFENLKTPYYSIYSMAILTFQDIFRKKEYFDNTLKAFYSIMIKSSSSQLSRIALLLEYAKKFSFFSTRRHTHKNFTPNNLAHKGSYSHSREESLLMENFSNQKEEALFSAILINDLALFCNEKNYWLSSISSLLYEPLYDNKKISENFIDPVEDTNKNYPSDEPLCRSDINWTENPEMTESEQNHLFEEFLSREKSFTDSLLKQDAENYFLSLQEDKVKDTAISLELNKINHSDLSFRINEIKNSDTPFEITDISSYLAARDFWFFAHRTPLYEASLETQPCRIDSSSLKVKSEFLNTYAYNMTAQEYITNPAIGREAEIKDLELILISPKKSPILIGEAGVGKTSVVEGLAYLLQRGMIPELLKKKKIYKLTTTSLLSGAKYVGEMEERVKQLMGELEQHPDVILFIDEIHTIVGAGSTENSNNDISNMLKPYIDRGDIKIIGATTKEEYQNYVIPDRALARRFYPILIEEPDEEMSLSILLGTIPSIEYETKVQNNFGSEQTRSLLKTLIQLSKEENQPVGQITKRPELPLTLLEMAFSYTALHSQKTLSTENFILAVKHSNQLIKSVRNKAEEFFL